MHGASCVTLSVSDTGHPTPRETAHRAFNPAFDANAAPRRPGLGFHNVQTFVNSLGGIAEISSSQANGACVRLHLPATS